MALWSSGKILASGAGDSSSILDGAHFLYKIFIIWNGLRSQPLLMDFGDHVIPREHVIIRTKFSFIFVNIRPFLPYHVLVSPIEKKQHLYELSKEQTEDLFLCVQMTLKALKPYGNDFTVSVQDGPAAGQTVSHIHVHVIPRNLNDLENNDLIYAKGALDYARRTRKFEEMREEALSLRKLFEKTFDENRYEYQQI